MTTRTAGWFPRISKNLKGVVPLRIEETGRFLEPVGSAFVFGHNTDVVADVRLAVPFNEWREAAERELVKDEFEQVLATAA